VRPLIWHDCIYDPLLTNSCSSCVDRREEQEQQRRQQEAARLQVEERIQEYRRLLIETCLTNKCPRCRSAWVDYDGCDAVACGNRACGAGFCGLCLAGETHCHIWKLHPTRLAYLLTDKATPCTGVYRLWRRRACSRAPGRPSEEWRQLLQ
jgi:hypothetical protein